MARLLLSSTLIVILSTWTPKLASITLTQRQQRARATLKQMLTRVARRLRPSARQLSTRQSIKLTSEGPRTLYDKIWNDHVVDGAEDGTALIYIDRHLVHEVTSPQAFEGLQQAGRPVRRPDCTLVTVDHNVPTSSRKTMKSVESFIKDDQSRQQVMAVEKNVKAFNLPYFGMGDKRQGIVHVSRRIVPPAQCSLGHC